MATLAHVNRMGSAKCTPTTKEALLVTLGIDDGCLRLFTEDGIPLAGGKDIKIKAGIDEPTEVNITFIIKSDKVYIKQPDLKPEDFK